MRNVPVNQHNPVAGLIERLRSTHNYMRQVAARLNRATGDTRARSIAKELQSRANIIMETIEVLESPELDGSMPSREVAVDKPKPKPKAKAKKPKPETEPDLDEAIKEALDGSD